MSSLAAANPSSAYPPRTSSLPPPKAITVSISGCSSSGKTTLALLLSEIFSTFAKNIQNAQVSLDDFLHGNIAFTEKMKPLLIYEDAYFKDKSYCPNVTFVSTPADVDFVQHTIKKDDLMQYTIIFGEDQPSGSYSVDDSVKNEQHNPPYWYITGPDTDCWSALDIPGLAAAIQHARKTGNLSDASLRQEEETRRATPDLLVTAEQRAAILEQHADIVSVMKERVEIWFKCEAAINTGSASKNQLNNSGTVHGTPRPTLCFIEGFLLYPDPANTPTSPNIGTSPGKENTMLSSPLRDSSNEFVPRDPKRNSSFLILEAKRDAFQTKNVKARANIMQELDIKLFLPSSKEHAQSRRFMRDCYIDAPLGTRLPGQLWKSDGYFNDVAWGNYVKEQGWLFQDKKVEGSGVPVFESGAGDQDRYPDYDDSQISPDRLGFSGGGQISQGAAGDRDIIPSQAAREHGVHIHPVVDSSVEDTVEWAVQIILQELKDRAWAGKAGGDAATEDEDSSGRVLFNDQDSGVDLSAGIEENKKSVWRSCFCF